MMQNVSVMNFNLLPENVILQILSFVSFKLRLRIISFVCKKWHRICDDPALVREASFEEFQSMHLSGNLTLPTSGCRILPKE